MKISRYLLYKRSSIILYITLMIIINGLIVVDIVELKKSTMIYLNSLTLLILLIYLLIEYIKIKRVYTILDEALQHQSYHKLLDYYSEDLLMKKFAELFTYFYHHMHGTYGKIVHDKNDFSDYLTSWIHSIKTPITASRLLIDNHTPSEYLIAQLESELDTIETYIEQALYYARLDSFSKDYLIGEVYLKDIIHASLKRYAKYFIEKKIKVSLNVNNKKVLSDKKWLLFIINQIISNAVKYTNLNDTIQIWVQEDERKTTLHIKDSGMGIREEDLPRIFNKGFTGSNGRVKEHSTGIGLYLAKKMVKKLGHDIKVSSRYGQFTVVKIVFYKFADYTDIVK